MIASLPSVPLSNQSHRPRGPNALPSLADANYLPDLSRFSAFLMQQNSAPEQAIACE
jgi:hypothetical protein